jgi:putative ABC transport system substrate-binding protein
MLPCSVISWTRPFRVFNPPSQTCRRQHALWVCNYVIVANARTESDLETAFASFSQQHVGGVVISVSNLYNRRMERLAALTAYHGLPAIFAYREFALAGGLIGYGSSIGYLYNQLGIYAGRILKGEKPNDLPVVHPTRFDLVINLKTAKALGLTIPETLLATADEVIQ